MTECRLVIGEGREQSAQRGVARACASVRFARSASIAEDSRCRRLSFRGHVNAPGSSRLSTLGGLTEMARARTRRERDHRKIGFRPMAGVASRVLFAYV